MSNKLGIKYETSNSEHAAEVEAVNKALDNFIEKAPITLCEKCGEPITIGDWPICPHGSVHRRPAAVHEKERAVKYYHPKHGWRTPGRSDLPMPDRLKQAGYQRVEFDSLHSLQQHGKRTGSHAEVVDFDRGSGGAERSYGKV